MTLPRHAFAFGENWIRFLAVVNDERIAQAIASVQRLTGLTSLQGRCFLDIGSGSGLFSLAARRLGATVHSFDYDPASVACARELKRRYAPKDPSWQIEEGSILDESYVTALGTFDIVYSWGVLHHTGQLWDAVAAAQSRVAPGGRLCLAIYNDQGRMSRVWHVIKHTYNRLPTALRPAFVVAVGLPREIRSAAIGLVTGQIARYVRTWTAYDRERGMSRWHDLVDWIGGYPFEVSTPDRIVAAAAHDGFLLYTLTTCGRGLGCNQYGFVLAPTASTPRSSQP
jgi:2-polyprenyl-3-methyl-5-hydroxy-6-metoxy-1,4-benzoquinol methylase